MSKEGHMYQNTTDTDTEEALGGFHLSARWGVHWLSFFFCFLERSDVFGAGMECIRLNGIREGRYNECYDTQLEREPASERANQ